MEDTTQRHDLDDVLIRDAKENYLDGYHIDLSKYDAEVTYIDDVIAQICFTSNETGQLIYVDGCYYDEAPTELIECDECGEFMTGMEE